MYTPFLRAIPAHLRRKTLFLYPIFGQILNMSPSQNGVHFLYSKNQTCAKFGLVFAIIEIVETNNNKHQILLENLLNAITAGIAASKPSAVANNASAMPGATTAKEVSLLKAID